MTQVEKRGIAGAYKKGCSCDVRWNGDHVEKRIYNVLINRSTFAWTIEDVTHRRQHANGHITTIARPNWELACLYEVRKIHQNLTSANGDVHSCIRDVWAILERDSDDPSGLSLNVIGRINNCRCRRSKLSFRHSHYLHYDYVKHVDKFHIFEKFSRFLIHLFCILNFLLSQSKNWSESTPLKYENVIIEFPKI